MTVSVLSQTNCLWGSLVLGLAAGVWYDLLRCIRRQTGRMAVAILLDLLFWCVVTAAIFLWSVAAGDGKAQLSVCLTLFTGGALYFRFLSPGVVSLLTLLLRGLKIVLMPLFWLKKVAEAGQKFFTNFCRNHFSFSRK